MRDDYLASDAERDAVAARLRDGAAEGRLDPVEFEQRLDAVYTARTHGQLAGLIADLPGRSLARTIRPKRALPSRRRVVPALRAMRTLSSRLRMPRGIRGTRVLTWISGSLALSGVWLYVAGLPAPALDFLDFYWPIFPMAVGAGWVWRSRRQDVGTSTIPSTKPRPSLGS